MGYTQDTEPPAIYHRWAILTALAAYLERDYYLKQGHFNIYPNLYVMLIGGAGARKNTAINIAKFLIKKAGYRTLAATKTTKEKFFIDLSEQNVSDNVLDDVLDQNLFGGMEQDTSHKINTMFIASGEFNVFFGNNILDFLSDLGEMWDYDGPYESKIKNGKSVTIYNPTINILGGNTPTTLASSFPPEIIGQGFFSRLIMVWGYRTRDKITFPEEPDAEETQWFIDWLREIKPPTQTKLTYTPGAKKLLDKIYKSAVQLPDPRFESYHNRRFTQLLKLCILCMCSMKEEKITEPVVIYANTILAHAEIFMPKALGEFGMAKNSDTTHKVLQVISDAESPISIKGIWKQVHHDLENISKLGEILKNLSEADKIQHVKDLGFLPKLSAIAEGVDKYVDYSLLTQEERNMKL
jgi:hypothetical protein